MDKATRALAQKVSGLEKQVHRLSDELATCLREQFEQSGDQPNGASQKTTDTDSHSEVVARVKAHSNPSTLKRKETEDRWYNRVPWWAVLWKIIEGAGVAAVVWYAVITYRQWQDLRRNFRIEQRAWITAKPVPIKFSEMGTVTRQVTITNTGKIPASNLSVVCRSDIISKDASPIFDYSISATHSRTGIVFPGDSSPVVCSNPTSSATLIGKPLTPHDVLYLVSGHSYLVTFGEITYVDGFGYHWTRFCSYFTPNDEGVVMNYGPCAAYNEADPDK